MSANRVWVLLALTAVAAAGCSSSGGVGDTPPASPMGRSFVSTAVSGTPIPGGGPLTLHFADGRVSATAGCNTATGPVDLQGNTLHVGKRATTLMGCPGDLAGADGWQDGLLRSQPTWTLVGDTLTLEGNGSTVTLLDRKAANPDKPLTGTTWIVTALLRPEAEVRSATLDEVRPTLTITPDGKVSGTAGCNTVTGTAAIDADTITFTLATTRKMCEPQVMELETQVLQALDGKTTATIDSDQLTLRNSTNNTGLKLRAQ
ncbi:META domain-containing protein [Nocardia seriolae]|uniref:META domain-containing protein n=1 Tax=Nocardia seriolae TaxID=37332 RepID=UPI00051A096C|nr:META domain-containing protein [Nocardia seriolae]MTJ62905.1 META domain-containing protein [Nocardia seriolae]MTJ72657.1 META domain-containing protein [Nocardia seriolae]MTJ87936.1 META domain-containing protein [Nocardia seriolae]MTK31926.1 META domain-containing protein [Nocardia seriolae]MTK40838.1 META domain-containing protein [Nocardia seriolae]